MTWRFDVMKWACIVGLTFVVAGCNGAKAPENSTAFEYDGNGGRRGDRADFGGDVWPRDPGGAVHRGDDSVGDDPAPRR